VAGEHELGEFYTVPVILSFDGAEAAANRSLGGVGKKVGGRVGKDFSAGVASGVASAETAVKKATASIEKLQDRQATAADKTRLAEEKLTEAREKGYTGSRLTSARNAHQKALRDEAALTRDAKREVDKLTRAQKDLADAQQQSSGKSGGRFSWLDGLSEKANRAAESMGAAGDSGGEAFGGAFLAGASSRIASLGTKAGPIGLAIAAAGAVALAGGVFLMSQIQAGMERQQDEAKVAAQLGVDPATMSRIADAAADAYVGNFGDTVAGNMDAARVAIQNGLLPRDADQAAIDQMIERLTTVSTIMGEDIPAVARAAEQAIRTGLAGNAVEAFDLLVRGEQLGLNKSQDLLDTINEYGTQFRKLGLDGREALGLINQMLQGGARDSDVAADALKEFSIRAVDGSKLTEGAFQALGLSADDMADRFGQGGAVAKTAFDQVVDSIRAIDDPVKKSQIAVALFGTQAEDLGAAFDGLDLSTAVQQFGEVDGAVQRASDTMGNTPASAAESARRSVEQAWHDMQDNLATEFAPAVTEFANLIIENKDTIGDVFTFIGQAAIGSAEVVVGGLGGITKAVAFFVSTLGDSIGFVLKGLALIQDWRGADEEAEELRNAADAAFGWGEGLNSAADSMIDAAIQMDAMRAGLGDTGTASDAAKTQVDGLHDAIANVANQSPPMITPEVDTGPADQQMQDFLDKWTTQLPTGGPVPGAGTPGQNPLGVFAPSSFDSGGGMPMLPSGGGQGGGFGTGFGSYGGVPRKVGSDSGLLPQTVSVKDQIATQFGDISDIGGFREDAAHPNEHPAGKAIDVMIPNWNTPQGKAEGDKVAAYALQQPGVRYVLWQRRQWNPDGTSTPMEDRGGPTANHMDHVHVHVEPDDGTAPSAPVTKSSGSTSAAGYTLPTVPNGVPPGGGSYPTTTDYDDAGNPMLRYGPQGATPGTNEYGEPGFYVPDPKAIKRANEALEAIDERIQDADESAAEARRQREALGALATEDDRRQADRAVERADKAAAKAREDKQDAITELGETQKGTFTQGKEVPGQDRKKKGDRGGGTSPLDELGSIGGSFLKETLGIGSWLPDLLDNPWLQGADALMGSAVEMFNAYANGDWQPGGLLGDALGTSNAPFGIPEIAAPPLPPEGQHPGSGAAPGPAAGNTTVIDQSINGNVGWDPAQVRRERDEGLARVLPRIKPGA
jgi:phage-related minor tail protein